ncbi:hypothetical protein BLOT_010977 [Blomia tropicalis]|nr:hypothetical protein BLOT_010977 [Blomia tropicalis]
MHKQWLSKTESAIDIPKSAILTMIPLLWNPLLYSFVSNGRTVPSERRYDDYEVGSIEHRLSLPTIGEDRLNRLFVTHNKVKKNDRSSRQMQEQLVLFTLIENN